MTTAVTLDDLFDRIDLEQAIAAGYVRTQDHRTLPLTIHNYTELAAYEGVWNPVTRQCRGLIAHSHTGEIVARPFPKFMNHGQDGAHIGAHEDQVIVTDKMDGSLGIYYPTTDGGAIATRGSFASDQAIHASAVWRDRYAGRATVPYGWTFLFEIVFPQNRIVVDYGNLDDLVLLGAVNIATGDSLPPDDVAGWSGPRAQTFPYRSLADALAAPDRSGREGLVVHYVKANERIKLKQAEYVELHKLVTGMNERVVWEHLGAGKPLDELIAPLPDEFHGWVRSVAERLYTALGEIVQGTQQEHDKLVAALPHGFTRRDYAELAAGSPLRPWLFLLLDGRDPAPKIWRTLRPSGANTMTSSGEDVA